MAFEDLFIEALHVICREGRLKCNDLIEDTTEGPDVTLDVIGLVPPNLWACVVRGTSLCVVQATLVGHLGYIHVSKLGSEIFIEENVRTLEVSVHDVEVMHSFEAPDDLNKDAPNILLGESRLLLLMLRDLLEQVTVICVLHDDTSG